ncbi:MAG: SDR family oxidoreductase [Gammaproteobacteria bacterium]|nr:SDR family oxidoreductase [Gammaproteobacteria bacterium]
MNTQVNPGVVIVTGASSGIGATIAGKLASCWSTVACLSRSGRVPEGLEEHPAIKAVSCDVSDEHRIKATFGELAAHGPISALVNNAGIHSQCRAAETSTDELRALLEVNAIGLFVACREVYPYMQANGGGQIVNIGSFMDHMGVPTQSGYCASKAAVGAITRCLGVEWARDGIEVVNLAPGYVATDMNADFLASEAGQRLLKRIPLRRAAYDEEVAGLVERILAARAPYLTGTTIYMDGGFGVSL